VEVIGFTIARQPPFCAKQAQIAQNSAGIAPYRAKADHLPCERSVWEIPIQLLAGEYLVATKVHHTVTRLPTQLAARSDHC
jgi:hypothetical protein